MNSTNRIGIDDRAAINSDTIQSITTRCGHCRRRKPMWIICSMIVLVCLTIISATIIMKMKTMNCTNISPTEESTTDTAQTTAAATTKGELFPAVVVDINTSWDDDASTVAGGNDKGNELHQLDAPDGIYVDDEDRSIYISDTNNNRIVQWKFDAKSGVVVAGGNEAGSAMNQLEKPTDVILDKNNNALIICDYGNTRVIKWYRGDDTNQQIMISPLACWGLTMDKNGDLYVSDNSNNEVRCWKQGETNGIIVAGGYGAGSGLNQLNGPQHIFVDEYYSVYVADFYNARVMKWSKDAKEGILVARAFSESSPDYSDRLSGVIVDQMGNVYGSDTLTCKITRWSPGATKGDIVVGKFGCGNGGSRHLFYPTDSSFDRQGNLYIADMGNNRIQKFAIHLN